MKVTFKKTNREGFALVEMIGVLAVVAILTAMLIPKVFETINTARVNSAASAVTTVKTAVATHYSKYGSFVDSTGTLFIPSPDLETTNEDAMKFDTKVLLKDGMIEKRFAVKLGDQLDTNRVRVRQIAAAAHTSEITPLSANYDMDGVAEDVDTNDGALIVECVLTGVSAAGARSLKEHLDGSDITGIANLPAVGEAATLGRVKYEAIAPGATGTLLIYVAHR